MLQWFHTFVVLFILVVGQGAQVMVPRGQYHTGDLATTADSIRVDGEVAGDVTSWSGDIVVSGRVDGDVVSYIGNVTIEPGGSVGGSALALAGRLQVSQPNALAGQAISGGAGGRVVDGVVGLFGGATYQAAGVANLGRLLLSGVAGALLLGLSLMFLAAWPQRSMASASTLRRAPGLALLLGTLATLAIATLTPIAGMLLASTVLGLPLAVVLLLLVNVVCIHGLAVLVCAACSTLEPGVGAPSLGLAALVAMAIVAPIVLLAIISPAMALGAYYLLAAPGLGALLLSRGGTLAPGIAGGLRPRI
jgi:hypothetical protein